MNYLKKLIGCMVLMTICAHAYNEDEKQVPISHGSSSNFVRVLASRIFGRSDKLKHSEHSGLKVRSVPDPVSPLMRAHIRMCSQRQSPTACTLKEQPNQKQYNEHDDNQIMRIVSSDW